MKTNLLRSQPHIDISDTIDDDTAHEVAKKLELMCADDSIEVVVITINSKGGFILPALNIYDQIKYCQKPVVTLAWGNVSSSALLILSAGSKGHRYVSEYTIGYLHFIYNEEDEYSDNYNDKNKEYNEYYFKRLFYKSKAKLQHIKRRIIKDPTHNILLKAKDIVGLGLADKIGYPIV